MLLRIAISLLILSVYSGCGNYSLIEKLGPSDGTAYLQVYNNISKSYLVYTEDSTGTITTNTNNLIMVSTNTTLGEEFLYSYNSTIKNEETLIKSKYGWQKRFRVLNLFNNNITGATAFPEVIQYNFIEMPFISGNMTKDSHLQIISNYPALLTANPITIQLHYETENKTLNNNVSTTINDIEYKNCIKYQFIITLKASALEAANPYNTGDPIFERTIENIYYLAPKIGIIKHISLYTQREENNNAEQILTTSILLD